jgi:hypothetical protein
MTEISKLVTANISKLLVFTTTFFLLQDLTPNISTLTHWTPWTPHVFLSGVPRRGGGPPVDGTHHQFLLPLLQASAAQPKTSFCPTHSITSDAERKHIQGN